MSSTVKITSLYLAGEVQDEHVPPNRHQLDVNTLFYALLGSDAVPDIMSRRLAENLKLTIEPTNRRIIVANQDSGDFQGVVNSVPLASEVL